MWSGPRNISTAMMRAWENRPDTVVVDEPFYAAFLARTGLDHPARDEVIASQPTSPDDVVAGLRRPLPDGVTVHYAKHMTHHLAPGQDLGWARDFHNVLLIRDPAEVVASYVKSREACEPDDIGLLQQVTLLDQLDGPPVIDAADFLRRPGGVPALAVRLARDPLHRRHARLAAGPARLRRRLGAALVRRGVGLDRLRAVPPTTGRPRRPRRRGRRGVPSCLRAAPGEAAAAQLNSMPPLRELGPHQVGVLLPVAIERGLVRRLRRVLERRAHRVVEL